MCKRWNEISKSRPIWRQVAFELVPNSPSAYERTESFLSWLIPRASLVRHLTVVARQATGPSTAGVTTSDPLVWSNIVSATTLLSPHLDQLYISWGEQLVLSHWAATLCTLQTASFTAPQVVVRPGALSGLKGLKELRFKSHASPLLLLSNRGGSGTGGPAHSTAAVLPAGLTSLRLEGCNLNHLPPAVAALPALRDLVLTNNDFFKAGSLTVCEHRSW